MFKKLIKLLFNKQRTTLTKKFYDSNKLGSVEYLNNKSKHHNEFGPAIIRFYENGNKQYEAYLINGNFHNEYGPATIQYDEDRNISRESYYLNNNILSKEEWENQKKNQKKNSCDGKIVDIDGKKYKLSLVE